MKFSSILPLAAVSSAFVLPPNSLRDLEIEEHRPCWERFAAGIHREVESTRETFHDWKDEAVDTSRSIWDSTAETLNDWKHEAVDTSKNVWSDVRKSFDETFEAASNEADALKDEFLETGSDIQSWLKDVVDEHTPDHGHDKPNRTVYQLIADSPYNTKLAKLINEFDDLVEALNSTKGNYTVFAPTDKALDKIPEHAPKPSKEQLKKFLSYHVVPELYPAGRVLYANTAPTLLKSESLGEEPLPQRLAFRLRLKGITVNFYSRIIAANIFGTNGVVHGVDTPIFPPIGAIKEIDLFPGAFSTLELGLAKTGLLDELNTTDHNGGTLFAPNNAAFQKLGAKANAFLFSKYGLKYLKALLQYHVVPDNTLYSDAYYKSESLDSVHSDKIHVDLPTALKDRSLAVDIARYGPFIIVNVNGFNKVAVSDVVAEDGVIHVMDKVIIPPKNPGDSEHLDGAELTVEELKERLEPFVGEEIRTDLK